MYGLCEKGAVDRFFLPEAAAEAVLEKITWRKQLNSLKISGFCEVSSGDVIIVEGDKKDVFHPAIFCFWGDFL